MRHRPSTAAAIALTGVMLHAAPAAAADEPSVPRATLSRPASSASPAAAHPDGALLKSIDGLRETAIGTEPTAVVYLDRIAAGQASPAQVNDFAAYLAKRGMPMVAAGFQQYAVKLDPDNPTLWLNLGTILRTSGSGSAAGTAFKKSIALDPGNALAHYNLGALYDSDKHYDEAIEEYRRALVLDPDLADPRKNPQVVNNENLLAVKLEIYQNQAGSLGLPLLQMQKNVPPRVPAEKP